MIDKLLKSDNEWAKELPGDLYRVAREKGTERPFSGKYVTEKRDGTYLCACCDAPLFKSDSKYDAGCGKYDAGCGWPSFTAPVSAQAVESHEDRSHSMVRTEITCTHCGAHLGHVFDDGPGPTGERYCINSVSLNLKEKK